MVDVSGVPFVFKRLDHLVLRTENIEKLREFYLSLGCNVVRDLTKTLGLLQLRLGVSMLTSMVNWACPEAQHQLLQGGIWIILPSG